MISLKSKQSGFTIVELLIVIIVIGILAALVLVTFSGVQQKARNTERTTDAKAIASHLEVYNAQNGRYPQQGDLTDCTNSGANVVTWITTNMKGLDKEALRDPKNNTQYCLLNGTSTGNQYGYVPSPNGCDDSGNNDCTSFQLSYFPEGQSGTPAATIINSLSN